MLAHRLNKILRQTLPAETLLEQVHEALEAEPAAFVHVVLRGFENIDGPEVDVFADPQQAEEHLRRAQKVMGDEAALLTEQVVLDESYLPGTNA